MSLDTTPVADYVALGSLAGRTAVVAGAGHGIGRQTAHALAQRGAFVLCVDVDAERADAVAGEVGGAALVADACEPDGVTSIVEAATSTGRPVEVVVDIIGISAFATLDRHDEDLWRRSERMNLRHAVLLTQGFGPVLAAAGGGAMVFVASVSGLSGAQNHAAYGAHKAALISLVRTAAIELGPVGVRVNAVAPGVIWTDRISAAIGEEKREMFLGGTPLGRLGEPSDVASVVGFLATDLAHHVSGQTVVIDGGLGVRFPYPSEVL